jgi:site-specific DNA recombinase
MFELAARSRCLAHRSFQEELCRRYCTERSISVLEVFTEEGESAKTADRSALLRALEFCRKNRREVQAFVVAKVDRLARNTEDHFYIRRLLAENDVSLHSVTEPIGNSPTEKFVETMLAASAEFDNAIRRQRCTDGMISRIRQGIWPFRAPLGYLCANHKKRGEKKTRPDQPDPQVFPVIQRGLRAYAAGEIQSLAQLRDQLDAWGLCLVRRRRTSMQLVDNILGKYLAFYAGSLVSRWTDTVHEGLHVPMIDPPTAERIRLIRSGRARSLNVRKDRFNPAFPLRRTVRCGLCHRSLTGAVSRGNGGRYGYYFCSRADCRRSSKRIRRDLLHEAFNRFIRSLTPSEEQLRAFETMIRDVWSEHHVRRANSSAMAEASIRELTQRRDRIFELREEGTYSKEMFEERLRTVDHQMMALKQSLTTTPPTDVVIASVVAAVRWLCCNLVAVWSDYPPAARARLERFILPEGVYFDGVRDVRTTKLGLIFALTSRPSDHDSPEVDLRLDSSNFCMDYFIELVELKKELEAATKSTSRAA